MPVAILSWPLSDRKPSVHQASRGCWSLPHCCRGRLMRPASKGRRWFGTYTVLTRLRGGLSRSPTDVVALLSHDFPASAFLYEALGVRVPLLATRR